MKKIISAVALLLAGCQLPALETSPLIPSSLSAQSTPPRPLATVGTARELKKLADREARNWSRQATLVQLDAWNISANGKNDHPFEAIWKFYYVTPSNQATALAVICNSGNTELVSQEESINLIFSRIPIDETDLLDSPQVMKLAIERGIQWFPVQRMRLNQPDKSLIWQVRDNAKRVAMNAKTGQPMEQPTVAGL